MKLIKQEFVTFNKNLKCHFKKYIKYMTMGICWNYFFSLFMVNAGMIYYKNAFKNIMMAMPMFL